jgi:hypothetical protein
MQVVSRRKQAQRNPQRALVPAIRSDRTFPTPGKTSSTCLASAFTSSTIASKSRRDSVTRFSSYASCRSVFARSYARHAKKAATVPNRCPNVRKWAHGAPR